MIRMLKQNFTDLLRSLPKTNPFGEPVTVVGATKTISQEDIAAAISSGLTDVGENKVQEFVQKFPYPPCNLHFIGHLQTNKVKYIIGKVCLIQSCDSVKLAEKISELAEKQGINQNILLEVNVGKESQKNGFMPEDIFNAYEHISKLPAVTVKGIMTVLPDANKMNADTSDTPAVETPPTIGADVNGANGKIASLCLQMREIYDKLKSIDDRIDTLSMGMSADYPIAVKYGSNMLRIGSFLFGKRHYNSGDNNV